MDIVKPLLKDIFEGLTDEELRNTKISEIVDALKANIVTYSINQITKGNNGKTRRGDISDVPLYQIFFELEMQICERFPQSHRFFNKKRKIKEVFLLVRRLNIL